MKTFYKISLLWWAFAMMPLFSTQTVTAQVYASFQVFYDDLAPYGSWMQSSGYGYVWVPRVTVGFTPYHTNGYWVYTDYGWTWVSNYNWGWAPFHYGRWYYDPYYGWVWVPDDEWGPAWVCWRSSADYYGWAPMGPGISISVAYSSGYNVPYNHWTFVRNRDFGRANISNYYVTNTRNTTIINNTRVINNIHRDNRNVSYATGPDRMEVQKRTDRLLVPVALKDRNDPGQKSSRNELQLYRPQITKGRLSGDQPKPRRVIEPKEGRTPMQESPRPRVNPVKDNKPLPTRRDNQEVLPRNNKPQREVVPQRQNLPDRPVQEAVPPRREVTTPKEMPQRQTQPQREALPQRQQENPRINPRGNNDMPQAPRQQPVERPKRPDLDQTVPHGNGPLGLPRGKVL